MSSNKLIKFQRQLPQIKVIERFSPDIISFDTKDEFIEYLNDHKEELDKMTTQKLNKMFQITDYRITKIQGEISLKRCNENLNNNHQSDLTELQNEITKMQSEIAELKNALTNLVTSLVTQGTLKMD